MPELPEVETIVTDLKNAGISGLRIKEVEIFWDRTIAAINPVAFRNSVIGQKIVHISRRGKYIVINLSEDILVIHLRMTGKLILDKKQTPCHSHERVRLILSDHSILRYEDQRKFGKWNLVKDTEAIFCKIGLEPFDECFSEEYLRDKLKNKNVSIKSFLLDQRYVAGLGNIYVDEALWQAKIHPKTTAKSLSKKDVSQLQKAIVDVLKKGIENKGTSLGDNRGNYLSATGKRGNHQISLNVFRRNGQECPRCHTIIEKVVVAQRGTHFCPTCQIVKS